MATTSLHAVCDRARRLLEQNDIERAIAVAQHVLEYFPQNLEAHRILGEAYLAGRQFDQAQEAFSRVLSADPENIPALVGMGITHERQGRLDGAVTEFERAFEIKPDMPELRNQLLRLYTDAWGSEGAQLRVSRAGLARLYAKGHMLPQAIQEFRSVIDDQPDRFDARVGLAEALWRDGQEEATIDACYDVLGARADVLKANLLLGYLKLTSGDPEGNQYWTEAQHLDPYYTVARALFPTLPATEEPDTDLPDWDETAWMEQRTREEQARRAEEEAATTAEAPAEEDFFGSWMETVEEPQPAAAVGVSSGAKADDDFLASLLAFEGLDKDELADVMPEEAAASSSQREEFDLETDVKPFSFDDFSGSESEAEPPEITGAVEPATTGESEAEVWDEETEAQPFTLDDLGLSEEEIAALNEASSPGAAAASAEAEPEPFTLDDLGLSEEEIAALNEASSPQAEEPAASTEEPAMPQAADESNLQPFTLDDLGLSEEEIAALNEAATPQAEEPAMPQAADESNLQPFSLDDLGLSPDELTALDDTATSSTAESIPQAGAEEDLQSFSLDNLGLDDAEAGDMKPFDASGFTEGETPPPAVGGEEPFSLRAFDWSQQDAPPPSAGTPGQDEGGEEDDMLRDLQPFSLDDLDLSATDLTDMGDIGAGSLPPSLQPFSLDDLGDVSSPESGSSSPTPMSLPDEEETHQEPAAFGWQEPSSRSNTDFLRHEQQDDEDEVPFERSIFARLKQRREELPPEEQPPLPDVSVKDDDESMQFFSDDDISLRDDDEAGEELSTPAVEPEQESEMPAASAEPELTPFTLDDLGLSEEEIAALEMSGEAEVPSDAAPEAEAVSAEAEPAAEPEAEEPELTPFTLDDLGLSEEEIAALEMSGEAEVPSDAAPEAEAVSAEAEPAAEPEEPETEEPELTPFSLSDLGLSEEEIAALEMSGEAEVPSDAAPEAEAVSAEAEPAAEPEEPETEEPKLTPFSLSDLGLSEEEVAALEMSGEAEVPSDAAPEAEAMPETSDSEAVGEEAEVPAAAEATPFSLDDLGLDMDESETDVPSEPETAQPEFSENFGNLQPFSLSDLGLSDDEIASLSLGNQNDSELGLTEEELAGLDIGAFGDMTPSLLRPQSNAQSPRAGTPAPPEPEESTGDPTIDRLINLGRRQGFVDLNDIIDVVENPMSQPERIEEIGQALHHAGIEIRDGDEVIDMEEISGEEEYPEAFDTTEIEEPATGDEPELMPFSLSDLGLSEEEIAALGLDEGDAAPTEAAPADEAMAMPEQAATPEAPPAPEPAEEPELSPFSLSDLGLSDEEIAALESAEGSGAMPGEAAAAEVMQPEPEPSEPAAAGEEAELSPFSLSDLGLSPEEIAALSSAASQAASESPTLPAAEAAETVEDTDAFDFSVVEEHREEIATPVKRTEPRPQEEEPTASPEDAEFVAQPLEALDDIWNIADSTAEKPREEPARITLEPSKPARKEKEPRRESGRSTAAQRTPDRRPKTAVPRTEEKTRATPPREKERTERKQPDAAQSTSWRKKLESFIPTGDETLDEYLRQSQAEPDNYGLYLAIARLSAQTGRGELAAYQYKRLIKEKVALEQVVDDLQEFIEDTEDRHLLQRLHRLLGDAYSAQNRFREAIAEYSWTFSN